MHPRALLSSWLVVALSVAACATSGPVDTTTGGSPGADAASAMSSYGGSDDAAAGEDAASSETMDAGSAVDAAVAETAPPFAIDAGPPATGGTDCAFSFTYELEAIAAPSSATACDVSSTGGTECASTECCFAGVCVSL